ncbi:2-phosphosulfolactate phosphatase [Williamsia sterculiae]|uniref:Probable 2-phosphosulfolactate phosphatase n=1 Tax=Williamsia sterculiae TaxID=1344003 RepID=A0A1N7HA96_9NOCA|nr:2-phosphosulfolactate phosphatase [Williamsia sterculiae]SIS21703.1 2-phosphosulfolactate phosphatase [Williamsia sterculiae]
MTRTHAQDAYDLRCEWGLSGATFAAADADVVVVVDVLSFTTAVSVAMDRGVHVFPYRSQDDSSREFAATHHAVLAVGRSQGGPGKVSLSPASIRSADHLERLVLPSPNGSTIIHTLTDTGTVVLAASLRNAAAVGRWISAHAPVNGAIAVIPSGERWPDGGLRPAIEDLWGAGAIIDALNDGTRRLSPETMGARVAWLSVCGDIVAALNNCVSGRELVDMGYASDVAVAAEINQSTAVPVLTGGAYFQGYDA